MKKLLAMILALAMMLSACAFAEGYVIRIDDIAAYAGEQVILDLSGVGVGFAGYVGEENGGAKFSLYAGEADVLSLAGALYDKELQLSMTGISDVYSLDLGMLEGVVAPGGELELSEEDTAALAVLAAKALVVYSKSVTAGGTVDIEGEAFEMTSVEIPPEDFDALIKDLIVILDRHPELLEGSEFESFAQAYEALDLELSLYGEAYDGAEVDFADYALAVAVADGSESVILDVYFEGACESSGELDYYVELSVNSGEESYTLGFDLQGTPDDGSWLPAAGADAKDLFAVLQDETESQMLMMQAMSSGMMALSQLASANETLEALVNSLMSGAM